VSRKNILFSLGLAAVLLTSSNMAAAELKIAVVNPNKLLEDSPQAIEANKRLKNEFQSREKKFIDEQKSIKKLEDKLNRDSAVMSESERLKLDRDIRNKRRDLRRALDEMREDRTIRTNQELKKLQGIVNQAIKDVGKEEKYDIILYEGIAYAAPDADLTDKILKRMEKIFKSKK
jgi:outer membrane protein